jgi:UDP-N-acetylmuramoylalanine--D-glutamate ligase
MNLSSIKTITIFGSVITANAVRKALARFPHLQEVGADEHPDIGILSPGLHTHDYKAKYSFPLISEIEFADHLIRSTGKSPTYLVVSGTNGKTTTTHLLGHFLGAALAGNVGIPFIDYAKPDPSQIPDVFALEMSSYQIEQSPTFTPHGYILMNITEDHLDRHGTMENYAKIKLELATRQSAAHCFVYNGADEWTGKVIHSTPKMAVPAIDYLSQRERFSAEIADTPLLGEHNVHNLLAALTLASWFRSNSYQHKISTIKAVPHRLEQVRVLDDITYINDSKGTNPDSTIAALRSVDPSSVILLLGGRRKQASYAPMFTSIRQNNVRIIGFGEDGPFFEDHLATMPNWLGLTASMSDAIRLAKEKAKAGDIILLSPSCASFDEFHNFEERGNVFRDVVSKLST